MQAADGLVERLRMAPLPTPVAAPVTPPAPPVPPTAAPATAPSPAPARDLPPVRFPSLPPVPTAPRRRRLPAASVPVVLLSLGALCLLVAAVVFVAVTWSRLGLTGRTLVLVGVTAVFAAAAAVLTRKDLRGAAETFWLIVAGMLTLDLLGAQSAGLAGLDALDWRGTGALVGGSLAALGIGVGLWGRRQPVGRLLGSEVVGVLGALTVTATNAWAAENPAVGTTIAAPLLAALFVVLRRRVPVTAYGLGVLAAVTWAELLLVGGGRALESVPVGSWWADARGWPLLAAALMAAAVVQVARLDAWVRAVAAGGALLPLVLLANAPLGVGSETTALLRGHRHRAGPGARRRLRPAGVVPRRRSAHDPGHVRPRPLARGRPVVGRG